jgi:hypothetical protein
LLKLLVTQRLRIHSPICSPQPLGDELALHPSNSSGPHFNGGSGFFIGCGDIGFFINGGPKDFRGDLFYLSAFD